MSRPFFPKRDLIHLSHFSPALAEARLVTREALLRNVLGFARVTVDDHFKMLYVNSPFLHVYDNHVALKLRLLALNEVAQHLAANFKGFQVIHPREFTEARPLELREAGVVIGQSYAVEEYAGKFKKLLEEKLRRETVN